MRGSDRNPETEAFGLEAESFVGKDAASIRRLLDEGACTLVVATEGVPAGWPAEILETGYDAELGGHLLRWRYQAADGSWHGHYGHLRPEPIAAWDPAPAYVYTRQPRRTPETRVRPIVEVAFGRDGRCLRASALTAEFVLRNRLQMAALWQGGRTAGTEVAATGETVPGPDLASEIGRMIGLDPPPQQTTLRGVACREGAAGLARWAWAVDLGAVIFVDARMNQRVVVTFRREGQPTLALIEDAAVTTPRPLPPEGLRLILEDPDSAPRFRFDLYGARADIALTTGSGRHLAVDLLGILRPLAPSAGRAVPMTGLVLLARNPSPQTVEPRFAHEPMSNRIRIRGVPPLSFRVLHVLSDEDGAGFAAVALRWD